MDVVSISMTRRTPLKMGNKSKEGHLPSHEVRILSSVRHPINFTMFGWVVLERLIKGAWNQTYQYFQKHSTPPSNFACGESLTPQLVTMTAVSCNYNWMSILLSWRGCYIVPFSDLFLESLLNFWIKCTFILGVWGARLNMGRGGGKRGRGGCALKG